VIITSNIRTFTEPRQFGAYDSAGRTVGYRQNSDSWTAPATTPAVKQPLTKDDKHALGIGAETTMRKYADFAMPTVPGTLAQKLGDPRYTDRAYNYASRS